MPSDKYYHESGHAIITRLFDELFEFELVTVDPELSKRIDTLSGGGVKGKHKLPVIDRSLFDHDKAVLSYLAGFCVDELLRIQAIQPQLLAPAYWVGKLNEDKYSGDRDLIGSTFYPYIDEQTGLLFNDYITDCLSALFKILNDDVIWNCIVSMRESLLKNKTLNLDQVDKVLTESGFNEWKEKNKVRIEQERIEALD